MREEDDKRRVIRGGNRGRELKRSRGGRVSKLKSTQKREFP